MKKLFFLTHKEMSHRHSWLRATEHGVTLKGYSHKADDVAIACCDAEAGDTIMVYVSQSVGSKSDKNLTWLYRDAKEGVRIVVMACSCDHHHTSPEHVEHVEIGCSEGEKTFDYVAKKFLATGVVLEEIPSYIPYEY